MLFGRCGLRGSDTPQFLHLFKVTMDISKTLKKIQTRFWWQKMKDDVQKCVHSCDVCQRSKALTTQPGRLLQPLEISERK